MTLSTPTPPPVLQAQNPKQEYHKPSFEVIGIDMESPLLAGSGFDGSRDGYGKGIKKDNW